MWFLPSALNVKVKKFNQARVNGGSNYDSQPLREAIVGGTNTVLSDLVDMYCCLMPASRSDHLWLFLSFWCCSFFGRCKLKAKSSVFLLNVGSSDQARSTRMRTLGSSCTSVASLVDCERFHCMVVPIVAAWIVTQVGESPLGILAWVATWIEEGNMPGSHLGAVDAVLVLLQGPSFKVLSRGRSEKAFGLVLWINLPATQGQGRRWVGGFKDANNLKGFAFQLLLVRLDDGSVRGLHGKWCVLCEMSSQHYFCWQQALFLLTSTKNFYQRDNTSIKEDPSHCGRSAATQPGTGKPSELHGNKGNPVWSQYIVRYTKTHVEPGKVWAVWSPISHCLRYRPTHAIVKHASPE